MARNGRPPRLEKHSKTGIYQIQWGERVDGKFRTRAISTRTNDLAKAQAVFAQWLAEGTRAENRPDFRVWQALNEYQAEKRMTPRAAERNMYAIKNLLPELGGMRVVDLLQSHIDKYVDDRLAGIVGGKSTSGTIRRELVVLRAAINRAAKLRRIRLDDVPWFELPPENAPRQTVLTMKELEMFLRAFEPKVGDPVDEGYGLAWMAAETAARKTAIYQLQWHMVDWKNMQIRYDKTREMQSKKRCVPVPISKRLIVPLKRMYGANGPNGKVITTCDSLPDSAVDARVRMSWRKVKNRLTEQTGDQKWLSVTPHTLRHTWATQAVASGVSLPMVAGILGDAVITVTRNYMHLQTEHLRQAADFRWTG